MSTAVDITIKVIIGGQEHELTRDEAKKLARQLADAVGEKEPVRVIGPIRVPPPLWGRITCKNPPNVRLDGGYQPVAAQQEAKAI